MMVADMTDRLAARYRRFAEQEAHGRSPLYEAVALGVAEDPRVLRVLAELPAGKQQPNLLFAAVRVVCGTPRNWADFRKKFLAQTHDVVALMATRVTQTNEPGRCAVLLPVLRRLHQPLALIEVGSSAGLCLQLDRYGYDYDGVRVGREAPAPIFPCHAGAGTPIPDRVPEIAWRAGMDLNPIDLRDAGDVAWLEALVWPDQTERLARLRAAMDVARATPARVRAGDLTTDLPALVADAPVGPTIVVFHSAVLGYVTEPAKRDAFARAVCDHAAVWVSHEVPATFPAIAERAGRKGPAGSFLLAVNGHPVAWTDPHGAWIDWLQPH